MINPQDDVIAAIATPIGEGGIAVIRVSGKSAIEITDFGFHGKIPLKQAKTHTAHYGSYVDSTGEVIDEVVATVFRSPHSYTAEDSVEISCHGGLFVSRKILVAILGYGARPAGPGEFTKRAFLNGRIDLSQAEAVADIIHSRSELSHHISLQQLKGTLSRKINEIRNQILNFCSLLELELDFAEENLEFTDKQKLSKDIESTMLQLNNMIQSYNSGKVYREGVKVVIAGKPNVGKSSILNSLLDENRAIVTDIPGTTRDTIEENLVIDGILFRVIDTAGIRQSDDSIELEGIRRSQLEIETSDIVVYVIDVSDNLDLTSDPLFKNIKGDLDQVARPCIMALNKIDLATKAISTTGIDNLAKFKVVRMSAKTKEGLDELKRSMVNVALQSSESYSDKSLMITNVRHRDILIRANESLAFALNCLNEGKSGELTSIDLRSALDSLGEVTGIISTDDILNNIFSNFCIGK